MTNKTNPGRSFGIVFFIFFLIIALYPEFNFKNLKLIPLIIAFIFLLSALIIPKILLPLNKIWMKFGELLGKFVSPIVMGIIYFLIITPIGIILRIFKKDLLKLRFTKEGSYWVIRKKKLGSMKKQF
tara:strand:- start:81 stop:461 length:381 start_codon:yes stop_codon:yes gene_type:complete